MMMRSEAKLILLGLGMLFGGWLVIFLMAIRVLEPSFLLSFLGYGASLAGLVVGLVGILQYTQTRGQD